MELAACTILSVLMRDTVPCFSVKWLWKSFVFESDDRYFNIMYTWIIETAERDLSWEPQQVYSLALTSLGKICDTHSPVLQSNERWKAGPEWQSPPLNWCLFCTIGATCTIGFFFCTVGLCICLLQIGLSEMRYVSLEKYAFTLHLSNYKLNVTSKEISLEDKR